MPADGLALCKTGDGLNDHSLENRGGQILLARAVVDERLNVGLGEHAAAGSDGIKGLIIAGIVVEPCCIGLQKGCHLIDEGAGAAGTGAVHALLDVAVFKINDLGILAAQLDGHIGFRCHGLNGSSFGDDLLYKRNAEIIGKGKTAGAGDDGMNPDVPVLLPDLLQNVVQGLADLGVVAPVIAEQQIPVCVQKGRLYGGGSNINSKGIIG